MSARGVYGVPDPSAPKRSWWKTALVLASVGVAGYFVWPMLRSKRHEDGSEEPTHPPTETPVETHVETPIAPPAAPQPPPIEPPRTSGTAGSFTALEQEARSKGFSSVADYENSILLHARQLRDAGAGVAFAPHLAHLAQRS